MRTLVLACLPPDMNPNDHREGYGFCPCVVCKQIVVVALRVFDKFFESVEQEIQFMPEADQKAWYTARLLEEAGKEYIPGVQEALAKAESLFQILCMRCAEKEDSEEVRKQVRWLKSGHRWEELL